MLKIVIFCFSFIIFCFSTEIKPKFIIKTKAFVSDFVFDDPYIYIGNNEGSIEVFNLVNFKKVDEIQLERILSAKQELVYPKIISIDKYKNKLLFSSTTLKGYTNVWLYENFKLSKIISKKDKLFIKELKIINNENFLFATLANEVIKYNIKDSYKAYTSHLEQSSFSDMDINNNNTKAVVSSESGRVTLFDVENGKKLKEYESLNVDNVYKLAFEKNNIITAGKDRRVGVYLHDKEDYYIKSNFLVYCVALSPSGEIGVYSKGEENILQTFNVYTKKEQYELKGHFTVPTNIKFINEKQLFSSGDEKKLFYWLLP